MFGDPTRRSVGTVAERNRVIAEERVVGEGRDSDGRVVRPRVRVRIVRRIEPAGSRKMVAARQRGVVRTVTASVLLAVGLPACSGTEPDSADDTSRVAETAAESSAETNAAETTTAGAPEPGSSNTTTEAAVETTAEPAVADDPTADRPYDVFVPSGYDPATPTPLVLLLHGYTGSGESQESYFQFEPLAESRGFLYVHPDGTADGSGAQFWNATDACCAFGTNPPDDAAYLMAIIDQVSAEYSVDPKAIFLAGHSNGGFMSYRMACEHADTIAGIASLAGATFADPADCNPSEPISVLQVHGTNDETISYAGGAIIGTAYPSAQETVAFWATHNGCDGAPMITPDVLDLDGSIEGSESDTQVFGGCEQGAQVELWTIDDGRHVPPVTEAFSAGVVDFLLAHPKP